MYTVSGQKIIESNEGSTSVTIDFSTLKRGLYVLQIESENSIKTVKIVK